MEELNCLIVDDESLALDVLSAYISNNAQCTLSGKCLNAVEAATFLKSKSVDIIFIDINMPEISGLDFVRGLENKPLIVFTTAYAEYAVDGFELNALDYLLKPISEQRFNKTIDRAIEYLQLKKAGDIEQPELEEAHVFVKTNQKLVKIAYSDIQYIEAYADYVKIYTQDKRYVTLQTMKNMELKMPNSMFVRVHRSFIVNINSIQTYNSSELEINNIKIPVGKNYKENFISILQSKTSL